MILMQKDYPVMETDLESYIRVIDNSKLPYSLKDYVETTNTKDFKKAIKDISLVRDFFASRTLSISRDNAKALLNVSNFPQNLNTEQKLEIVKYCKGLSMSDSYWIKENDENLEYKDISLRKCKLSEIMFDISIGGKHIKINKELTIPDLTTAGMSRKTWQRKNGEIVLIKSDRTTGFINTNAEVQVSEMLDKTNVDHVQYKLSQIGDIVVAECKCIANDDVSLVDAEEVKFWCFHQGIDFMEYIKENFPEDFAKMCVIDYIFANTDRHINNWGFLIDNNTNNIIGMAPLYDHNQALVADIFNTNIDSLIYDPTNTTMLEAAIKYFPQSNLEINCDLPPKCKERLEKLEKSIIKEENELNSIIKNLNKINIGKNEPDLDKKKEI